MPMHEREPSADEPAAPVERSTAAGLAGPVDGWLTPALMRRVQQTAGNQAAVRLLARQGAAAEPALADGSGASDLLDLVGLGPDRNPGLTSDHKNAAYKALEGGSLGTPDADDVKQG